MHVIVTKKELTLSTQVINLDHLASHEEADTCIFVQAKHAVREGNQILVIKANEIDVVVVAVSIHLCKSLYCREQLHKCSAVAHPWTTTIIITVMI